MTSDGFLVDTNAAIGYINGDEKIRVFFDKTEALFTTSVIVLGELYFGAENSQPRESNKAQIEGFIAEITVLMCDPETAKHYGRIYQKLKTAGRPIPVNDIWIAATAIQHDLTLISRDHHFQAVDGLAVQNW